MPTSADTMIIRLRQWLDDASAGRGGPWGPDRYKNWGPRITDRRVLLDRFETHTKECTACRTVLRMLPGNMHEMPNHVPFTQAHARFGWLHVVAKWVAAVATAAATMATLLMARGGLPIGRVDIAVMAGVAVLAWVVSCKALAMQEAFVFQDYVHATR